MAEEGQVIVIDNGAYMCKAGFAGEDTPQSVFPPLIGRPKSQTIILSGIPRKDYYIGDEAVAKRGILNLQSPLKDGEVTDWEDMEKVWHHACYNELRIAPDEHPFLFSESPLTPKQNKEKLVQVLFESFTIPALIVSNTSVLALISSGRTTGCVLDCGYTALYSVPVFEGCILPYATLKSELGGKDLTDYMTKLMLQRGYHFTTAAEREILNDIKEKLCFCSSGEELPSNSRNDLTCTYEFPDGNGVTVGTERYQCPEGLFQPSFLGKEVQSLPSLFSKSITRCNIDIRQEMYMNIVLCGGSSMFPGLSERLAREIDIKSPGKRFRVISPPERKYSTWIGGSIMASLTYFAEKSITRQEYMETGPAIIHRKPF